jgi:hypothetical protein
MQRELTRTTDGQKVSYFRGRKLHARNLKVPKGYKGVVAVKTERVLPSQRKEVEEKEDPDDEGEGEQEPEPEIKVIEEESSFDEFVVWGHEAVMDEGDPYVRGVEEWIGFAEGVSFVLAWDGMERENANWGRFILLGLMRVKVRPGRRRSDIGLAYACWSSAGMEKALGYQIRKSSCLISFSFVDDLYPGSSAWQDFLRFNVWLYLRSAFFRLFPFFLLSQELLLQLRIPLMSFALLPHLSEHQTSPFLLLFPFMSLTLLNLLTPRISLAFLILPPPFMIRISLRSRHSHLDILPGHVHANKIIVVIELEEFGP